MSTPYSLVRRRRRDSLPIQYKVLQTPITIAISSGEVCPTSCSVIFHLNCSLTTQKTPHSSGQVVPVTLCGIKMTRPFEPGHIFVGTVQQYLDLGTCQICAYTCKKACIKPFCIRATNFLHKSILFSTIFFKL